MSALKAQAIQTALLGDWTNAILLNQAILDEDPTDIDALNRLAFAFFSSGDTREAKNIYQKVLSLDTLNPIAMRNLKRLTVNGKRPVVNILQLGNHFIEEPGKTKVVDLINIAEQKIIGPLRSGEILTLSAKRMKIFVLESQKQYVGMLPDDISKRLIKFIDGGNTYEAYVKANDKRHLSIFIRETKRVNRFRDQPSFVSSDKTKLTFEKNRSVKRDDDIDQDKQPYVFEEEESL